MWCDLPAPVGGCDSCRSLRTILIALTRTSFRLPVPAVSLVGTSRFWWLSMAVFAWEGGMHARLCGGVGVLPARQFCVLTCVCTCVWFEPSGLCVSCVACFTATPVAALHGGDVPHAFAQLRACGLPSLCGGHHHHHAASAVVAVCASSTLHTPRLKLCPVPYGGPLVVEWSKQASARARARAPLPLPSTPTTITQWRPPNAAPAAGVAAGRKEASP